MGAMQFLSDAVTQEFTSLCFKYLLMHVVIYVSQNRDALANS